MFTKLILLFVFLFPSERKTVFWDMNGSHLVLFVWEETAAK